MARTLCAIGFTLGLISAAMPAQAVVIELDASKDNTLYEEDDKKSNGAGSYFFAGNNDGSKTRRAVVGFDLGSIPPGSTINSVTLRLYMSRTQVGGVPVSLHRALAGWGEGASNAGGEEGGGDSAQLNDATWRYRFYDPNNEAGSPQWSALGGDFVAGTSATTSVSNNGFYTWSGGGMVSDVQGWLNGPAGNHGWFVRGSESGQKNAKRFNSRQNENLSRRPKLTVDYSPPVVTGACCSPGQVCQELTAAICLGAGGNFLGVGTDCTPNPCPPDPVGACCKDGSPWSCSAVTATQCASSGGTYQGDGELCAPIEAQGGCPVMLTPFMDALAMPPIAQPVSGSIGGAASYNIVMQEFQQSMHSELPPTTVWGYGAAPQPFDPAVNYASTPGPTIVARTGQPVTIRFFNQLRDTAAGGSPPPLRTAHYLSVDHCAHGAHDASPRAVVHLHGGHVPAKYDGYPEATFLPGQEAIVDGLPGYVYANDQDSALIWYHDHALGITRLNVYMGLAAGYIIRDDFEDSLGLPGGPYEVPLVIQDRTFRAVPLGQLEYPGDWVEHYFGDTPVVNGKAWPYLEVDRGKYRFRIVSGSTSRWYRLSLDRLDLPGDKDLPFQVIMTDGGFLPAPVSPVELTLGNGERADIIVDFASLPAGTEVLLKNSAVMPDGHDLPVIMKFVVRSTPGFTGAIPSTLRPVVPLQPNTAVARREFLLRKGTDACSGQRWEIRSRNADGVEVGTRWDDITEYPQLGSTEIWEFLNPTVVPHPMHMHLVLFQILNRQPFEIVNGEVVLTGPEEPPAPEEAGWKDTARAEPGKILRVITRFTGYAGKYPYHCHILEHEDHEMMRQFWTVEPIALGMTATSCTWGAVPGATGYDLIRGDLATLRSSGGNFATATQACLQSGLPDLTVGHGPPPMPGSGFWYLARKRDAIGKGTYDDGGASQVGHRDEEVASSGHDCP